MAHLEELSIEITEMDIVDIRLVHDDRIIRFSLNYRAKIKGVWHEVYRIDNHHGFLHEQRFWRSRKPIVLDIPLDAEMLIEQSLMRIRDRFHKYRRYYEIAQGRKGMD